MSEIYQYALWRVVPDAQRGETMNAGVVVFCRRLSFLAARTALDVQRLVGLADDVDTEAIRAALAHRAAVAAGDAAGGPVAALDPSERFGWLVAPASTTVQPGSVHTGLCDDPAATLEQLFSRLVLRATP